MMYLHIIHICCIFLVLYSSGYSTGRKTTTIQLKWTLSPKRLRSFETAVRLTVSYLASGEQGNLTRSITIRIINNYTKTATFNTTVDTYNNSTLTFPCDTFAHPGKYHLQYFVQGITPRFKTLRHKIIVRKEKVRIDAPRNHTAASGPVPVWISSNQRRCKAYKGTVQVFWMNGVNNHILVTTKKINKVSTGKRLRVQFHCHIFDTEGTFYFKYVSSYSNQTIARTRNMSVFWGKYSLTGQSKNIFPCSSSFAIKFSSPYCDNTEDKIELRSRAFDNIINSQTAYHGFRSVFFPCETFKRHIHDYCFYYITKSSLTKTEKIQAKVCPSSSKKEPIITGWSHWSNWGTCSSPTDCGEGRKFRLRYCPPSSLLEGTNVKSQCSGPRVESASCTLPPCRNKDCKSCHCVFTSPVGTIVSPDSPQVFSAGNKSSCNWWIKIDPNKTIKLWFDMVNLATNTAVHIIDGNGSRAAILKRVTNENQMKVSDISSSSNVILIRYYFTGTLNETNSRFQMSYSSVDNWIEHFGTTNTPSNTKRLSKMIFIGILVLMIVIMAVIFYAAFFKMRRQRREQNSKTSLSQPGSSYHTSTACMSESTIRSFHEIQHSGDESVNNNSIPPRPNSYHLRVPDPVQMANRSSAVHVCHRCCQATENCSSEYNDIDHPKWSMRYNVSCYGPINNDVYIERRPRYSAIELRSSSSKDDEGRFHAMYL